MPNKTRPVPEAVARHAAENKAAVAAQSLENPMLQTALALSGAAILTLLGIDPNGPNESDHARNTMEIVQRVYMLGYSMCLEHLESGKLSTRLAAFDDQGNKIEEIDMGGIAALLKGVKS